MGRLKRLLGGLHCLHTIESWSARLFIAFDQLCHQPVSHIVRDKCRFKSIPIAVEKVLSTPSKRFVQLLVLLTQRDIRYGTCIGVHAHRYTRPIEFIDGVIGVGLEGIRLYVGGWAYLEMDPVFLNVFDQFGTFETRYTVAEA